MSRMIAVIPARAGSKGIKDKNLRLLAGKSLIRRTVEAALSATSLSGVVVTSDSEAILAEALSCGPVIPVKRPAELAGDETPTIDAVVHALKRYEADGVKPDLVMLLQPTAPLRNAADIDAAAAFFDAAGEKVQSLVSCYDASHVHPAIMYRKLENGSGERIWAGKAELRRQEFEPVYVRNGAIYIARRDLIMTRKRLYDDAPVLFEMPRERSVNVDEETDLVLAEALAAFSVRK